MTAPAPDQRFTLTELAPEAIAVTERLVALREEHVLDLACHIERSGFVQPILAARLREPLGRATHRLIAGRHRTEACRLLGWRVPALVVAEEDLAEGEERLLEALENAGRLVLTHAQRVAHEQIILKHYAERLGRPLTREERAARVEDAAQRNGIAKRTAQILLQRAEELSPEVLEAVRGTRLDTTQGLDAG
jgi:ParB-like chromosome segregation protein Spo0J